jgi:hypothetical protein
MIKHSQVEDKTELVDVAKPTAKEVGTCSRLNHSLFLFFSFYSFKRYSEKRRRTRDFVCVEGWRIVSIGSAPFLKFGFGNSTRKHYTHHFCYCHLTKFYFSSAKSIPPTFLGGRSLDWGKNGSSHVLFFWH